MRTSTVFLSLITVVSLASAAYLYLMQPSAVAVPTTGKEAVLQARVKELETQLEQAMGEIKRIAKERQPAGAAAVAQAESAPAGVASQPRSKSEEMKQSLGQMMADPAMREMAVQQQQAQLEQQYAGLFNFLQLDPEEKLHFKQLLAARVRSKMDLALQLMNPALTTEQQKAIVAQMKEQEQQSNTGIQQFMNDGNDYQTFLRWEDSLGERGMVQMGRPVFENARVPLNEQQENQLVELMAGVRQSNKTLPNLWKPEEMVGQQVTDGFIQQQMAKYDTDAKQVLTGAAGFLSAEQVQALQQMLDQHRSLMQASIKMTQQMVK